MSALTLASTSKARGMSDLAILRIETNNMYPEFRRGDACLYRPDLNTFTYDACYVVRYLDALNVYRAQSVGNGRVLMKMDHMHASEQTISRDAFNNICGGLVVGRVNILDERYIDLWGNGRVSA
ncbi:hypothetical protein AA23498_1204 [Acetobacter nitrogenifigens DSM 23921 = NBRC 105050]|uniref:Peptidase S24/S26A/S26B/S26C domain-containing protein n=1 Tax=Acetobacter nitrogenifigens DSM 23921 = NBRC 105050 TaxID=1120919 RepID=A0A511XD88_9PROT|nr:hypothetical protein [Acetobacter nitrogenifigens]GBQ91517.1 hypothetical protein AA23498_1204 [Acetobacter nitrogenifigens DSM 23921 = NBRC 105050]GEN60845.1 hypothetical protein ANI02nite_27290 [Acetobacter nitrogenifigens DSM 23921 = NBRC 105050]